MKLFEVTMLNQLTNKIERSYIYSRNAQTAAKDLDCLRSHNYQLVNSKLI